MGIDAGSGACFDGRMRFPLAFALGLGLLATAAACTTARGSRASGGTCSESQEFCLAGRDCTIDRQRGCEVCVCRPADRALRPDRPAHARPEDAPDPMSP